MIDNLDAKPEIAPASKGIHVVLLDRRALERELFVLGAEAVDHDLRVAAFSSVEAWAQQHSKTPAPVAILYNVEGRRLSDPEVVEAISRIEKLARPVPAIVLSPYEEMSEMVAALRLGARGYIPATLGLHATLIAVQLAVHGGIFLPHASILGMGEMAGAPAPKETDGGLTSRQMAVAEALRRGKPNKLIAYELSMCESTVKVHIRNIMKKLKARNRTEASYKLNSLGGSRCFDDDERDRA